MAFHPLQRLNGFLGRMVPQDNYGGLLSPADQHAAGRDARAILASGLLSAAGPQRMPVSLGQALGASIPQAMQVRDQRAEVGLRNEQLRRQIDSETKRTAAREKLGGLLRNVGGEDGELLGLLYDVSPEAAIGMLKGQDQDRATAAQKEMLQFGYPLTQEGFAKYNADKAQGGDLAANLLLEERQARLAREKTEDERATQERDRQRVTLQNTVSRSLGQTDEISDLAQSLEGSFLEAGMPASSWRRTGAAALAGIGGALGMDVQKIEKDLGSFDRLKKNLSDQLINLMSTGDLGTGTNAKLQQFQNALASTETSLPAILAIQANIAETLLDEADNQEFEIPGRATVESNIKKWRAYEPPVGEAVVDAPAIVRRVADIGRMTADQIKSIDPTELANWTEEQRQALEKRLDALGF